MFVVRVIGCIDDEYTSIIFLLFNFPVFLLLSMRSITTRRF